MDTCEGLIVNQVNYSIDMNKYYVAVTSVLIMVLTTGSLYFLAVVLRFKSRVLAFFAELDPESMLVSEKAAREYYNFLVTDDFDMLSESRQELEEYYLRKLDIMLGITVNKPPVPTIRYIEQTDSDQESP